MLTVYLEINYGLFSLFHYIDTDEIPGFSPYTKKSYLHRAQRKYWVRFFKKIQDWILKSERIRT